MGASLVKLEKSHDVQITWHAYELRPAGSPPIPDWYLKKIEESRPRLAEIAQEQHGITINSGPFGIDSRKSLIGEKYADSVGKGRPFHDAVIEAYWSNAQDISDLTVLREIAESVGLDGDDFMQALDDSQYDDLVTRDVTMATEYGLSGVPALIFDNKYLVSGAQPYEVLVEVTEKVLEQMTSG